MTQFPHSMGSQPVMIFGVSDVYYQSWGGGEGRWGDGGADEAKKGKEEEQSECESHVQESTLDFIVSMENRHSIFYSTYIPRFVLR